jgi:hypothetical protein
VVINVEVAVGVVVIGGGIMPKKRLEEDVSLVPEDPYDNYIVTLQYHII